MPALSHDRLVEELCALENEQQVLAFVQKHRNHLNESFLDFLRRAACGAQGEGPYDEMKIASLAVLLAALGMHELEHQNFLQASSFYKQADELARALGNQPSRVFILYDWGLCCFRLGQHAEAIRIWDAAIKMFTQDDRKPLDHPELRLEGASQKISWVELLRHLGTAHAELGQVQAALSRWEQALALCRRAGWHDAAGWINTDFGNFFRKLWRFEEALEYDLRALAFHQHKGNRAQEGFTLSFIALIHSHLGPVEEAIALYKKSLEIARELKDVQEERNRLGNLARVCALSGQKERALRLFLEASALKTGNRPQDDEAAVLLHASIGNVHRDLGQPEKALAPYTEALRLARETKNAKMENRLLSSLGIVYRDREGLELAHTHFIASRAVAETAHDELGLGDAYGNLGNILYQKRRLAEAVPHYRKALELAEKLHDHVFVSRWRGNLANVYSALESRFASQAPQLLDQAEAWYREALALAEKNHDPDQSYLWNYNLGSLHRRAREQLQKAYDRFQAAIRILERIRRELKRDDFSRSFGESKIFIYQDMVNTCLEMKSHLAEAINFVERGKGYTLMRAMAQANLQPATKVPQELRDEFARLRTSQLHLESQIAAPLSPDDRIAAKPAGYAPKLEAELQRIYNLQDENFQRLAKYDPEFATIFAPQRIKIENVQHHLKGYQYNTVLVEFFVTGDQTNVFIVSRKDWQVIKMPQFAEHHLRAFSRGKMAGALQAIS